MTQFRRAKSPQTVQIKPPTLQVPGSLAVDGRRERSDKVDLGTDLGMQVRRPMRDGHEVHPVVPAGEHHRPDLRRQSGRGHEPP
jgi:hypothetical protein